MKYVFQNDGGINWSWLLCYQHVEGGVRIVFYDRWHHFDHNRAPAWVERCMAIGSERKMLAEDGTSTTAQIIETEGRVAVALRFAKYVEIGPNDHPWHLRVDGKCYRYVGSVDVQIVNSAYVFSYHDLDEVKAWIEGGEK